MKPKPEIPKNDKRTIHAWAMYDWANSVFLLVITSALFPAYYNQVTRLDGSDLVQVFGMDIQNTSLYAITLGLSFGMIAIMSPFLSSVADYMGNHRFFMRVFCYIGSFGCGMLFFFVGDNLWVGILGLMLASIGYSGSFVFYNSYLPEIASEDRQDKVSARGFAYGYIGASTLMILNLILLFNQENLGVQDDFLLPRVAFLITALWWFGFAHIPLTRLPRGIQKEHSESGHYLLQGYRGLQKVWNNLRKRKVLRVFLIAFFFYSMGLHSVINMAASFGEKVIRLKTEELIITILLLEYVGIAGAFLFAGLTKRIGNVRALQLAVFIWMMICTSAYFITTDYQFYGLALFVGMVMGGIQTISRSTYSKFIPKTKNNAGYFSFYDVSEKIAMMIGLILFGTLENITGSMRSSIITLIIWFFIGFIFLWSLRQTTTKEKIQIA